MIVKSAKKKQLTIFMRSILLILMVMALSTSSSVSGEVVWSDDFETDNGNWEMMSYYSATNRETGILESSNLLMNIENGKLQSPMLTGNTHWALATRNSTTAYGSWSFDWNIGENNESFAT
ncbi:MAG: hypothetical protein GPJ54_07520, partial [Candidatus Heimdallarchaeota archaeon]|nr:hypothetical protein [Candidatus Heimdallarchaeota archaeon]